MNNPLTIPEICAALATQGEALHQQAEGLQVIADDLAQLRRRLGVDRPPAECSEAQSESR